MATKQLLALLCALLCASSVVQAASIFQPYILGGEEALADDTPHAASLRVDNAHVCGCSIVTPSQLLTAAHCVYRDGKLLAANRMTIRVGSTNQYAGGRIVSVASVTPHPDYYQQLNNLAIIELSTPLEWSTRIQPIELASGAEDLPAVKTPIRVAGWGRTVDGTTSFKIRQLVLGLAEDSVCQDAYSERDEHSFCLAHELKEGNCYGDGGNGAVYDGKLVGVTNFVVGACGSRYPDVFMRVARYSDWLKTILKE